MQTYEKCQAQTSLSWLPNSFWVAGSCLLSSAICTEIAGAEIKLSRMGEWLGMGVGWSAGNKFNSSPSEVGLELRVYHI